VKLLGFSYIIGERKEKGTPKEKKGSLNNELNNTVLYHFNPRIKDTQEDRCDALLFDRWVPTFWRDMLPIFGLLLNIFYHEDQGSRLVQNAGTHLSSTEHHSQQMYYCENLKFQTARDGPEILTFACHCLSVCSSS
jgi:hypothetical protein